MKLFLVPVAALAALLSAAAGASAAISITTDTSGQPQQIIQQQQRWIDYYQPLAPYGTSCSSGRTISLTDSKPVLLKFSWVTSATNQIQTFFKQTHGTYTLSGPAGTATESWSETSGAPATGTYVTWSQPFSASFPLNGGALVPGYVTGYFGLISGLTAGTYTLDTSWTFDKNVYDGWGVQKAGTYTYHCSFAVQ